MSHLLDTFRILNVFVLLVVVGLGANFIYFAPKEVGDKFITAWKNLDGDGLLSSICEDSAIYQEWAGSTGIFDFGALLGANAIIDNQSFTPINNEYYVEYRFASFMGAEEPETFTLHIKPENVLSYCIDRVDSVDIDYNTATSTGETQPNTTTINSEESGYFESSGWRVYLTDIVESPSTERGWKSVELHFVLESVQNRPYSLYPDMYVSVLDSTETWRGRSEVKCCAQLVGRYGGVYANTFPLLLLPNVRFKLISEPIQVPEIASIQELKLEICGSDDCDPQYAVFEVTGPIIETSQTFQFPVDSISEYSSPYLISDQPIESQINRESSAKIVFQPNPHIKPVEGWYEIEFETQITNLSADNIGNSIFERWSVISVRDTGIAFVYNFRCDFEEIPPGYTDTVTCGGVVDFGWEEEPYSNMWVGVTNDRDFVLSALFTNLSQQLAG